MVKCFHTHAIRVPVFPIVQSVRGQCADGLVQKKSQTGRTAVQSQEMKKNQLFGSYTQMKFLRNRRRL